jgi:hypothetical protein
MNRILCCLLLLQPFAWLGFSGFQDLPVAAHPETQKESGSALNRASALLDSQNAPDRAWGAYLAAQNHLAELQPKLEGLLQDFSKIQNDECLVHSLLEAEIQLEAVLPESTLATICKRYPGEATILFSRAPEKYTNTILSLFTGHEVGSRWLALGNMLLAIRTPKFPLLLMQQMEKVSVYVTIEDLLPGGQGQGGSYGRGGMGPTTVPSNYPPVVFYSFSDKPNSSAIVTFKGPTAIYAIPAVVQPGDKYTSSYRENNFYTPWDAENPNPFRVQYLSSFLELPNDDISFSKYLYMEWEGPEQYKEALRLYLNGITGKFNRMAGLLLNKGFITPLQANDLKIGIFLRLQDFRSDKTPLPDAHSMNSAIYQIEIGDRAYY